MNPYLRQLKEHAARPRVHAKPNFERLHAFAEEIALKDLSAPAWREPVYPEDDIEFVQFLGMISTINFYYTDAVTKEKFRTLWPECRACGQDLVHYEKVDKRAYRCLAHERPATLWEGAFAMTACLKRALGEGIPITEPRFLRDRTDWTSHRATLVFRGVPPLTVIPMLAERYLMLQDSAWRLQKYDDEWMNILRFASFRAFSDGKGVVETLAGFESFSDEYPGFPGEPGPPLPFYKRAHLFVQMYEGRARSSDKLPRIKDPELLILPADYELPKAFHSPRVGAFDFSPELTTKLRGKEEIQEGSVMEIELRLGTVELGETLQESVNVIRESSSFQPYTKVELDYPIWLLGEESSEPHHLTRTTKY